LNRQVRKGRQGYILAFLVPWRFEKFFNFANNPIQGDYLSRKRQIGKNGRKRKRMFLKARISLFLPLSNL
jgi:hypothetical protein